MKNIYNILGMTKERIQKGLLWGSVEVLSAYKFLGNLINLEYCIYPNYSHLLLFILYFSSTSPILLPVYVCKIVG